MVTRTLERWPRAGSTISSAAASIATRPIAQWLVPHFEKMLYDNAQLARVYLEAVAGRPAAPTSPRSRGRTLDYVAARHDVARRRVLRRDRRRQPGPDGRAPRATTSRGRADELDAAARRASAPAACARTSASARRARSTAAACCTRRARARGRRRARDRRRRSSRPRSSRVARTQLLAARARRGRRRIATTRSSMAWNGLMISALARGGFVARSSRDYVDAARARGGARAVALRDARRRLAAQPARRPRRASAARSTTTRS